eukprot:4387549-Lingulodinium_polyedra.AAC.1
MTGVRGERELSSVACVARARRFRAPCAGMADVRDERTQFSAAAPPEHAARSSSTRHGYRFARPT